jgi:hypothetical protein
MSEPVVIGRATLYLGDCRDILPTLGKMQEIGEREVASIHYKLGGGVVL